MYNFFSGEEATVDNLYAYRGRRRKTLEDEGDAFKTNPKRHIRDRRIRTCERYSLERKKKEKREKVSSKEKNVK